MSYEEIEPFIVIMKEEVEKIDSTIGNNPNNCRQIVKSSLTIRSMIKRIESVLKRE